MEQYIRGASRNNALSFQNPKSMTAFDQAEADPSVGFDCNICLDPVQDPVVTLCGHLYCWPCIYRWITFQDSTSQNPDLQNPQCPVCKSEVSEKTLIPLYGRGQTTTTASKSEPSPKIPQRPASPRCWNNRIIPNPFQQLHNRGYNPAPPTPPDYSTDTVSPTTHLSDPMIGVFGEMVYSRIFGNSDTTLYTYPNSYHLAGSSSPRLRRHAMLIDKSLSRVCFFLFCCVILCLFLF